MTTRRWSAASCRTAADPTSPKPPVTTTVPDMNLPKYDILFFGEYHIRWLGPTCGLGLGGGEKRNRH